MEMHAEHAVIRLMTVADRVRAVAVGLRQLDGVRWHSLSADRFRSQLAAVAQRVDRSAELVDDAARTVGMHARALRAVR